jgi:hypothetical protein
VSHALLWERTLCATPFASPSTQKKGRLSAALFDLPEGNHQ